MRWTRWTVAALSLASAITAVFAVSCTVSKSSNTETTAATAEMTHEQKIARGRVITFSSGCIDCHTPGTFYGSPDTTRMLSGSELGWEGPWGVTYPRNLTPDMETGIGSWTEEQIVTAVRTGQRPDKSPLLPPMPWPAYSHMSDDDAYALAAYLKTLPPVRHKAPDRIPPGTKATGPRLTFPPPPAWDAQNLPPPPTADAAPASGTK
jgi:mono/diheme cytochrome c family protein